MIKLVINYSIAISLLTGLLMLFINQQLVNYAIDKNGLWPKNIDRYYRPWGLAIKDLKIVIQNTTDIQLKSKLKKLVLMRKIGFWMLFAPVPLDFLASFIIELIRVS